jgi:hypothetical protein
LDGRAASNTRARRYSPFATPSQPQPATALRQHPLIIQSYGSNDAEQGYPSARVVIADFVLGLLLGGIVGTISMCVRTRARESCVVVLVAARLTSSYFAPRYGPEAQFWGEQQLQVRLAPPPHLPPLPTL